MTTEVVYNNSEIDVVFGARNKYPATIQIISKDGKSALGNYLQVQLDPKIARKLETEIKPFGHVLTILSYISIEDLIKIKRTKNASGQTEVRLTTIDFGECPSIIFRNGKSTNFLRKLELYLDIYRILDDDKNTCYFSKRQKCVSLESLVTDIRIDTELDVLSPPATEANKILWPEVPNVQDWSEMWDVYKKIEARHSFHSDIARDKPSQMNFEKRNIYDSTFWPHPGKVEIPTVPEVERGEALNAEEWSTLTSKDGIVLDPNYVKKRIFKTGMTNDIRSILWKYLLGYYKWNLTLEENILESNNKRVEYAILKSDWLAIETESDIDYGREQIEKDLVRFNMPEIAEDEREIFRRSMHNILLTFHATWPELGYGQGMDRYCYTLKYVLNNEADTYWCFKNLVKKYLKRFSYLMDKTIFSIRMIQIQIHTIIRIFDPELAALLEKQKNGEDYIYSFRAIVLNFSDSLSFSNYQILTECMLSDYPSAQTSTLFFAAAFLSLGRQVKEKYMDETDLFMHFHRSMLDDDFQQIMCNVEKMYGQLKAIWYMLPKETRAILNFTLDDTPI